AVRGLTFHTRGGSSRGGALLELLVAPAPQRIEAAAQAAIDEALRLGREEVPADELSRARAALERDVGRGAEGVEGRARRLGFAAAVAGDAGYDVRYRQSLAALTPATLREGAAPWVAVEAAWAGGARAEDAGSNGAGALIAALLDRGTRTRSAEQISADARALGGTLAGFSDRSHLGLRAEFLPSDWARG